MRHNTPEKGLGNSHSLPICFKTKLVRVSHLKNRTKIPHSTSLSLTFMRITALPALKENLLRTFLLQDKSQRPGSLSSWQEQQCFRLHEKWILAPYPRGRQCESQTAGTLPSRRPPAPPAPVHSPHRPARACWCAGHTAQNHKGQALHLSGFFGLIFQVGARLVFYCHTCHHCFDRKYAISNIWIIPLLLQEAI